MSSLRPPGTSTSVRSNSSSPISRCSDSASRFSASQGVKSLASPGHTSRMSISLNS